jgi:hypothetical protein
MWWPSRARIPGRPEADGKSILYQLGQFAVRSGGRSKEGVVDGEGFAFSKSHLAIKTRLRSGETAGTEFSS